ncbi:ERO1-domain-containing protein [Gonapodya prolifera JEL478]|uniref:ERO1-domain-containing protein n=1 Tax=Gonapodya prolifera (strain JEL478) TaxID=1344416 RepID=A0A139A517_GONPJ|nr:ERO1-domain-containing protein [Gonapodya prolifera JEL478]|eukprot:KXS11907.1 ERO1-domain-containing protein [Gonapodya prolifera JEL478]
MEHKHDPLQPCCSFSQLDAANERVLPSLQNLVESFFFRFYRVNLWRDCEFWKDGMFCTNRQCAVEETVEADLPDALKSGNLGGVDLSMSSKDVGLGFFSDCNIPEKDWCILDNESSGDGIYVDLIKNPERFTGYSGESAARVWRAIYSENCFDITGSKSQEPVCAEKRVFYRIISGLHASISLHICNNWLDRATGEWGPNLACFQQRIAVNPQYIQNIYLDYVVLARAIGKISPYLEKYRFCAEDGEHEEVGRLVKDVVAMASDCPSTFDEKGLFADGDKQLIRDIKDRFRNVSRIMDCVSCEKCRMWGKLQMTGLGTALKILFSYGDNPTEYRFTRTEIVALFNTLHRYSSSIESIKRFRRMEREELEKLGLSAPDRLPEEDDGSAVTLNGSNESSNGAVEIVTHESSSFATILGTLAVGFVLASIFKQFAGTGGSEERGQ